VAQIVEQGSCAANDPRFAGDLVMRKKQVERSSHDVHHAYRVSEPAVLGALIGEHCEPELSDPA
jgi:hypothetical protein